MRAYAATLLVAALCGLMLIGAGCGSTPTTLATVEAANQPSVGQSSLPAQYSGADLLAQLDGQPGPGGLPRQVSATEFTLIGMDYTASSSTPPSMQSPANPEALRLIADNLEPFAFAVYDLLPAEQSTAGLAKRVQVDIAPAEPWPGAGTEPLEYYIGLSSFTHTRWTWRGPYSSSAVLDVNSAASRDRFYDLSGRTLVAIAIAADLGTARAADIQRVGWDISGEFFPTRPFRPKLDAGNFTSSFGVQPGEPGPVAELARTGAYVPGSYDVNPGPFEAFGFESADFYRRDPGSESWILLGSSTADAQFFNSVSFLDPLDSLAGVPQQIPGATYEYAVRLINAVGSTADTAPVPVTIAFSYPALFITDVSTTDISLAWSYQQGVAAYEVWRDGILLAGLDPAEHAYTDPSADGGAVREYLVKAISNGIEHASSPASAVCWPFPHYEQPLGGGDQLVSIGGRPAVHVAQQSGDPCSFSILEAISPFADSADLWELHSHSLPGLEAGSGAVVLSDTSSFSNFAILGGEPVVALDNGTAGSGTGTEAFALAFRDPPGNPPLPPELRAWNDAYAASLGVVTTFSLANIGGRLAFSWCDETSQTLNYARADVDEPAGSVDWTTTVIAATPATSVHLVNMNGNPAVLADEGTSLAYYSGAGVSPTGPEDWMRTEVGAGVTYEATLGSVAGKAFVTYNLDGNLCFARAEVNPPLLPEDWIRGVLHARSTTRARFVDDNGFAVIVFAEAEQAGPPGLPGQNADELVWFAQATTSTPSSAQDWDKTPLQVSANYFHRPPGILKTGSQLYVTVYLDRLTGGDDGSWYFLLPPSV